MRENIFSCWERWHSRNKLGELEYPGVYALALSTSNIAGRSFSWRREIIYVGMTNAVSGLKGRLKQFDNAIRGKHGHGGGERVRYRHRDYERLTKRLYVAVAPFKCDVTSNAPADLRTMGDVAQFEFLCFARYVEKFRRLPEFNDKKASPKLPPRKPSKKYQ